MITFMSKSYFSSSKADNSAAETDSQMSNLQNHKIQNTIYCIDKPWWTEALVENIKYTTATFSQFVDLQWMTNNEQDKRIIGDHYNGDQD